MRPLLVLALLAIPVTANAAAPHDDFEGIVTKLGPTPPAFYCGIIMTTQTVTLRVTKVHAGSLHVGDSITVTVMTCGGGTHFRKLTGTKLEGLFELDPAKVGAGAKLRIDQTGGVVTDRDIKP